MAPSPSHLACAQANAAWAAALVRGLLAEGPRCVVVAPGSRSTPLVLALAAAPEARLHVVVDERSAAFFALGLGRQSGRAAVVVCTSGSAGLHMAPAVAEAHYGGVPLVVVTADRPPESQGVGAAQTGDQTHMFGRLALFFAQLPTPRPDGEAGLCALAVAGARACFVAEGGQGGGMGAAHLNMPARPPLWLPEVEADVAAPAPNLSGQASTGLAPPRSPAPRLTRRAPAGLPEEAVAEAAAQLTAAGEMGLIFCGPQPARPRPGGQAKSDAYAGGQVAALAARLGWPMLAEAASQWRFGAPPEAPLITTYGALLPHLVAAGGPKPRCILRFGGAPTATPVAAAMAALGRGCSIQVAADGGWRDPSLGAVALWEADPWVVCRQLLAALPPKPPAGPRPWLAAWQRAEVALSARSQALCREGFWEGTIAYDLAQDLPAGCLWQVGNSQAIRNVDAFAGRIARPQPILSARGLSGIDGGLAQALGAACAAPAQTPLVALMGDLALLHDVGSLCLADLAAGRCVVVVVVNNDGGAIFGQLPIAQSSAFERFFRAPHGRDLASVCAGFGVSAQRVTTRAELRAALALSLTRPHFQVIEACVPLEASHKMYAAAAGLAAQVPEVAALVGWQEATVSSNTSLASEKRGASS